MNIFHHGKGKLLLIMKLIFTFIVLFVVGASAEGLAQKLDLSVENASLEDVFSEISRQTDYRFFYNEEVLENTSPVTVTLHNSDMETALGTILSNQNLNYRIIARTITISRKTKDHSGIDSVNIQVSGVVRDSLGVIPGVLVSAKSNPALGTVTDTGGRYTLNVPEDETLVFSFMGYETVEEAVEGRSVINVLMKVALAELEEVVVVGYGMQKKAHVTGSVSQISSEELLKAPMSNATNMLAGKLPGLVTRQSSGLPGADQSHLMIRGAGTFNDSSPLLLVDGVERNFNRIDPNDIESVTILKDAAAAAVYGVRAAHGVILVKTKRGKAGEKPSIAYSQSHSLSSNTRFPEFLNGVDYAKWHNKARELDGQPGHFSEEDIAKIANGDPEGILGNTDWVNSLFKDYALMTQHNLSVSGGNEKVLYYVSTGYMNQEGIIPNTSFKRFNLRSNVDVNINEDISLSLNVAGRKEDTDNPGFGIAPNNGYNPITQAIRALPVVPSTYQGTPTATGDGASTWNPLMAVNESGFNKIDRYVFESSGELEYRFPFLKGLSANMFLSYDHNFTEQRNFLATYDVAKFNQASKTYSITRADGTSEKSSLFQAASNGFMLMSRPSLRYQGDFGKHSFGGLLLYEYRETGGSSFQASRRDFLIDDIPELSFALEDVANSIFGSSSETRMAGYVGRFNYAYSNKYLAEFSFRYDGSYKFHKDYRWGFFPSISVGWVLSEEDFFKKKNSAIDYFKLRASFGELGRDNIDAFLYRSFFDLTASPSYALGRTPQETYALYTTNSVPSYDLTWEKTRIVNGGLELTAWRGLLSVELDAFYKYTYDILQAVAGMYPPSIAGNYQSIENSGAVDSRGFELSLTHRNTVNELNYSINGNLSWARNKVLERTQADNVSSWRNVIGRPIGEIYGFRALGLFQTEEQLNNRPLGPGGVQRLGDLMYEDINGDGKLDYADMVRIAGSSMPEMIFSLGAAFQWKGFDASFQLQGAAMADVLTSGLYPNGVMDQTEFARAFYNGGNAPYYLVENSWTPENTNARYPRLGEAWNGNNGWTSDWWVVNGAYLRLKQVTLGYTLPEQLVSKINSEAVRIYLAGTNLLTFDYLDYMDPEMPSNNNGYYPQQRTFSLGLNVTF